MMNPDPAASRTRGCPWVARPWKKNWKLPLSSPKGWKNCRNGSGIPSAVTVLESFSAARMKTTEGLTTLATAAAALLQAVRTGEGDRGGAVSKVTGAAERRDAALESAAYSTRGANKSVVMTP